MEVRWLPNMNLAGDKTVRSDSLEDGQTHSSPLSPTQLALQEASLPPPPHPRELLLPNLGPRCSRVPNMVQSGPGLFLEPGALQVHTDGLATPASDSPGKPRTGG